MTPVAHDTSTKRTSFPSHIPHQGLFGNRGGSTYLFEFIDLISLLNLAYLFVMLLNLGASLWVWTAYRVGTTSSWMTFSPLGDISGGPATDQYLAALYFTSTTFSTVGMYCVRDDSRSLL